MPNCRHAPHKLYPLSVTEYLGPCPMRLCVLSICCFVASVFHEGLTAILTILTSDCFNVLPGCFVGVESSNSNFCLPTDMLSSTMLTYSSFLNRSFAPVHTSRPAFSHQSSIVWWLGVSSNSSPWKDSLTISRIDLMERTPQTLTLALRRVARLTTNSLNLNPLIVLKVICFGSLSELPSCLFFYCSHVVSSLSAFCQPYVLLSILQSPFPELPTYAEA